MTFRHIPSNIYNFHPPTMEHRLIFILGISGAGKSFLASVINGFQCLDQDAFYFSRLGQKDKMPRLNAPENLGGKPIINYDSMNGIDWKLFNQEIHKLHANGPVIVTGFALRSTHLDPDLKPDLVIHLNIPLETSLERRLVSKGYKSEKQREMDKWMMDTVIYPTYLETVSLLDNYLEVYDIDATKSPESVRQIFMDILSQKGFIH